MVSEKFARWHSALFSFGKYLPDPLILASSPDARVGWISSRIGLTVSVDLILVNPFCSVMASIKRDFVIAISGVSFILKG